MSSEKIQKKFNLPRLAVQRFEKLHSYVKHLYPTQSELLSKILMQLPEELSDPWIAISLINLAPRENLLDVILQYKIYDSRNKRETRRLNEVWVSELVYCPMRPELAKKYPELADASVYLSPSTLLGELAHLGIRFFARALGYETEKQIYNEITIDDERGEKLIISGRIDIFDSAKQILWDLKTGRDIVSPPSPHHALQAWFYKLLTNASEARILYITSARMCEVKITETHVLQALRQLGWKNAPPLSDIQLLIKYVQWWRRKEKVPLWAWECDYCIFSSVCPHFKRQKR